MHHSLFIHLLTDICVVSTFLLLLNSAKYFSAMIWVPVLNLGVIYLGVEFLGHMDIFEKSRNWTFKQCLQEICFFSPKEMAEISENWVGGFGGDSTMCYVNVLIQASVRSGEPHSSTLAWKIAWTEEPGGLPSMGSHRVGHDWSNLAAAAAAATYHANCCVIFFSFNVFWILYHLRTYRPSYSLLSYNSHIKSTILKCTVHFKNRIHKIVQLPHSITLSSPQPKDIPYLLAVTAHSSLLLAPCYY